MKPEEFAALNLDARRHLLRSYAHADHVHNSQCKSFQVSNFFGVFRLSFEGRISYCSRFVPVHDFVFLTEKQITALDSLSVRNPDFETETKCLDTARIESWLAFSREHVTKALKIEEACGGGSLFSVIPARMLAARIRLLSKLRKKSLGTDGCAWWRKSDDAGSSQKVKC